MIPEKNVKLSDTSIEVALDRICNEAGIKLVKGREVAVPGFTISPDRQVLGTNILIECDGTYHTTQIQRRKSSWRDDLLIQAGYRIFHIESELLVTHGLGDTDQFHPYVLKALNEFIASNEKVHYLRA